MLVVVTAEHADEVAVMVDMGNQEAVNRELVKTQPNVPLTYSSLH